MSALNTASLLLALLVSLVSASWNPVANSDSVVLSGSYVRFTVLTDRLIRCEYSETGEFIDSATLAFVNRYLDTPTFNSSVANGVLTIDTDYLTLTYDVDSGEFTSSNLQIVVKDVAGSSVTWNSGVAPTGNLLGTIRTLDSTDGAQDLYCPDMTEDTIDDNHCTLGLISRDGWVLYDDSEDAILDDSDWPWIVKDTDDTANCALDNSDKIDCNPDDVGDETQCVEMGCCYDNSYYDGTPWCYYPRNLYTKQDWYFFGYGHDYAQALYDFTLVSGEHPMIPRYVYGPQFSRWYAYNEVDERLLVEQGFVQHDIPLDVLVLDMDWHTLWYDHNTYCPNYNSWTGFTWNTNLFSNPARFISWLHNKGIHTTLNNHPDAGVQCIEATYSDMASYWNIAPTTNQTVPYVIQDKTWSSGFFDIVLEPIQENGVDYWWVDYQQGEDLKAPGVNPTWWVNYVFTSDPTWWSDTTRPMLMARWGGLGNHRFSQIGFSGDVTTSWESLAFQPYFTATASNVGGFMWSHDTGGFEGQPDGELYTRWVQWSLFSPTLRTHCNGKDGYYRDIWLYDYTYFKIMREAFQLRAALIPYIASAAHDLLSGIGLLRPLYYYWPEDDEAYTYTNEYMFGEYMLVSPVVSAGDDYGLTAVDIWLPEGTWVEWFTGKIYTGPTSFTREYMLNEIPVFVKAGSVIPMRDLRDMPLLGSAAEVPDRFELLVFPGADAGSTVSSYYYEDDGTTTAYTDDEWTMTEVDLMTDTYAITLTINPYDGDGFDEMPSTRTYRVKFLGVWPATSVMLNGASVSYEASSGNSWTYEGTTLSLIVDIQTSQKTTSSTTLKIAFSQSLQSSYLQADYKRSLNVLQQCKDMLDEQWPVYYPDDYDSLLVGSQVGVNMTTTSVYTDLPRLKTLYSQGISEISALASTTQSETCLALLDIY